MKVFINPGHAPNGYPDPGAVSNGVRECDVVANVGNLLADYLTAAGVEVVGVLQHDDLCTICDASNNADADVFISLHCNSAANPAAEGAETFHWHTSAAGKKLAGCIQNQIVHSLKTCDRGVKKCVPGTGTNFYVVRNTDAVAVLVEMAFISNADDRMLLENNQDDFARAIARGVTDYQQMI